MRIIKLDAISSTNDYLKEILASGSVDDVIVVTAENQTHGRGQRGAKWIAEPGKNLIMSVFVRRAVAGIDGVFGLNAAVALSVLAVLNEYCIPGLSVKWPNDIMSGNKKLGGILIENSVKSAGEIASIIGIGLNVNQTDFVQLPNASSLSVVTGKVFDRDALLVSIVQAIQEKTNALAISPGKIWQGYNAHLFRKGRPTAFQDTFGNRFMGIIIEASADGLLHVRLPDDAVKTFSLKEITMLY